MGVSVSEYTDINMTVQNGQTICAGSEVKSLTIGVVGWSNTIEKQFACNEKVKVINEKEYIDYWTIGPVEVSKKGIFIGIEIEGHFVAGGHVKTGFQINW